MRGPGGGSSFPGAGPGPLGGVPGDFAHAQADIAKLDAAVTAILGLLDNAWRSLYGPPLPWQGKAADDWRAGWSHQAGLVKRLLRDLRAAETQVLAKAKAADQQTARQVAQAEAKVQQAQVKAAQAKR